jgi:excisionase family DNA binding protein
MDKKLYTRKEAAQMLSISVDTLDKLRCAGKIRSRYIGARVYISSDELTAFVRRLEDGRC